MDPDEHAPTLGAVPRDLVVPVPGVEMFGERAAAQGTGETMYLDAHTAVHVAMTYQRQHQLEAATTNMIALCLRVEFVPNTVLAVLDTVAIFGTWTWLLKLLAVQFKPNHDHQSFMPDLVTTLFKTPDASQSRILCSRRLTTALIVHVTNEHQGWLTMVNSNGYAVDDKKACDYLARQMLASSATSVGHASALFATSRPGVPMPALSAEGAMLILNLENCTRRIYHAQVQAVQDWVQLLSVTFLANVEAKAIPTECKKHFSEALVLLLSVLDRKMTTTKVELLLLTQLLCIMLGVIKARDASIVVPRERLLAVNAVGMLAKGTFLSYHAETNLAVTQGAAFAPGTSATGTSATGASFADDAATEAMGHMFDKRFLVCKDIIIHSSSAAWAPVRVHA
ncbi:hypothetical protein GGF32_006337 [Allomyces javanicus]|nr:hypothetical protein GGF32_006337 [Allomyces javanicus]